VSLVHVVDDVFLLLQRVLNNHAVEKRRLHFSDAMLVRFLYLADNRLDVFFVLIEKDGERSFVLHLSSQLIRVESQLRLLVPEFSQFVGFFHLSEIRGRLVEPENVGLNCAFQSSRELVELLVFGRKVVIFDGGEVNQSCPFLINYLLREILAIYLKVRLHFLRGLLIDRVFLLLLLFYFKIVIKLIFWLVPCKLNQKSRKTRNFIINFIIF